MGMDIPVGFTAGPWFARAMGQRQDGEFFICTGVPGDEGCSIFEGGGVTGDDDENAANAALMALAPEMAAEIAALRAQGALREAPEVTDEMVSEAQDTLENVDLCGDQDCDFCRRKIRAALTAALAAAPQHETEKKS